jgi:hypothetical protein
MNQSAIVTLGVGFLKQYPKFKKSAIIAGSWLKRVEVGLSGARPTL